MFSCHYGICGRIRRISFVAKPVQKSYKTGMFENPIMDMTAICIALIFICVAAFIVILKLKKKFDPRVKTPDSSEGMNMEALEKIHDSGMITDEEFTKMRRALLGLPPFAGEKSKKV